MTCSECLKVFDDLDSLEQCGHSFCPKCVDERLENITYRSNKPVYIADTGKTTNRVLAVRCPICRKMSRHPNYTGKPEIPSLTDLSSAFSSEISLSDQSNCNSSSATLKRLDPRKTVLLVKDLFGAKMLLLIDRTCDVRQVKEKLGQLLKVHPDQLQFKIFNTEKDTWDEKEDSVRLYEIEDIFKHNMATLRIVSMAPSWWQHSSLSLSSMFRNSEMPIFS